MLSFEAFVTRFTLACALLLVALPARAQSPEPRWQPWIGCWELSADNVRDGAPAAGRLAGDDNAARPRNGSAPRVCVMAAADGGARFETTLRGQAALEHTIVPGAAPRAVDDQECRGIERAEWSADGLRVFTRAELTCAGDPAPRKVSGLSLIAPDGTWLDIQSVELGSGETVRVRRYVRADDELLPATAGARLDLDDVKEAAAKVTPRVIEAALVETNAGFDLSGEELVGLDEAGVPGRVIDLLVALSYPDRFIVEREMRTSGRGFRDPFFRDPFMLGWAFGYPVWYDDYYYSPYYYSPFAYSRYGFRPYDGFGGGGVVSVVPGAGEPQPSGAGRVVDGQGYTRVRPRPAAAAEGTLPGSAPVRSGSNPAPTSSSGSTASSGSSGSSGGSSSGGGYSSGSTSTDTGRTAQPR